MENELVQQEQEVEVPVAENAAEISESVETEEVPVEQAADAEETETPEETEGDQVPEIKPDTKLAQALSELEKLSKRLGYEQRQREKLEREIRQSQQMPRIEDVNAPQQDDFDTYEAYQQAYIDYRVNQGITNYQRQQVQRTQQSSMDGFINETTTAGREKYNDFDSVVLQNHVPITQPMLQIMANCEHPESIAYYLGKNLTEATAISRMSPIQATRARMRPQQRLHRARVVVPRHQRVRHHPRRHTRRVRQRQRRHTAARLNQQQVRMTVVTSLELNNLFTSSVGTAKTDHTHACLGS